MLAITCFCQLGFSRSACAKAGAIAIGLLHGCNHAREGVSQDQRSPRADVVDVFIAVGVPDAGTFAAHDVRRLAANGFEGTHRRIHPAGDYARGASMEFLGFDSLFHFA